MKCYRKNGSDLAELRKKNGEPHQPSMKCYRKNGSDLTGASVSTYPSTLNEVLPKER